MYLASIRQPGMAGMGDVATDSAPGNTSDWLSSVTSSIKDIVTTYNQQQILQANIDRARLGLPAINTAALAPTYNVGLAPDTKNMLMLGGLGLLSVLLLTRGSKS